MLGKKPQVGSRGGRSHGDPHDEGLAPVSLPDSCPPGPGWRIYTCDPSPGPPIERIHPAGGRTHLYAPPPPTKKPAGDSPNGFQTGPLRRDWPVYLSARASASVLYLLTLLTSDWLLVRARYSIRWASPHLHVTA